MCRWSADGGPEVVPDAHRFWDQTDVDKAADGWGPRWDDQWADDEGEWVVTLFDSGDYWRHPGLWPGADDTVMSEDQAAELLWPGITSTRDWSETTVAAGPAEWGMEAML